MERGRFAFWRTIICRSFTFEWQDRERVTAMREKVRNGGVMDYLKAYLPQEVARGAYIFSQNGPILGHEVSFRIYLLMELGVYKGLFVDSLGFTGVEN